ARSFVTRAQLGISDVLKYAGHPSNVRCSQEDAPFQNAPSTSDKLEDKQRCRNDKPIMTSTQTCKTVDGKNQACSQKTSGNFIIRKVMTCFTLRVLKCQICDHDEFLFSILTPLRAAVDDFPATAPNKPPIS
ncbi:hypothetical protein AVEN_117561-1, partial [Araneus ventricosus]